MAGCRHNSLNNYFRPCQPRDGFLQGPGQAGRHRPHQGGRGG